jgi:acetyltransferase
MMKDGSEVTIRPVRPEDEGLMVEFHKILSDETVYRRYFQMQRVDSRVAHKRLVRKCFLDYDREMALVADRANPGSGMHELLGVGRLAQQWKMGEAELGVLVADRFQRAGLGTELVRRLIHVARIEKIHRVVAHILSENEAMVALAHDGAAGVGHVSFADP